MLSSLYIRLTTVFFSVTMDIRSYLLCNSRGAQLKDHFDASGVNCKVAPGAKLALLQSQTENIIKTYHSSNNVIYIMGGIPDITTRLKGKDYDEVIFEGESHTVAASVIEKFKELKSLENAANKIVFCTITTVDLFKWNSVRVEQQKTKFLYHIHKYSDMQHNLNTCINEINRSLTEINSDSYLHTPFLHRFVTKNKRNGRKHYQYQWLEDGVHPSRELVLKWIEQLETAIKVNQTRLYDIEVESDEDERRVWLKERDDLN